MLKQQFEDVLAEFGELVKQPLELDDDGIVTFTVDNEVIINLQYLEESDFIIAFAPVGAFGGMDAPDAGKKAMELLRMNEIGGLSVGFTLAIDEDADLVLAMERHHALSMAHVDSLAAWMDALVRMIKAVRNRFAELFPIDDEGRE